MAVILFGWELGNGLGYARRLAAIADRLSADGHQPVLALRDPAALGTARHWIVRAPEVVGRRCQRPRDAPPPARRAEGAAPAIDPGARRSPGGQSGAARVEFLRDGRRQAALPRDADPRQPERRTAGTALLEHPGENFRQADDTCFVGSYNHSRSGEENAENVLAVESPGLADQLAAFAAELAERYRGDGGQPPPREAHRVRSRRRPPRDR